MTRSLSPLRARLLGLLVPAACLALAPTAAGADTPTKTRTVPGQIVFEHGANPTRPGNCSALAFVKWAHVPDVISVRAFYTWRTRPTSVAGKPPYDDRITFIRDYAVPAGSHWLIVSRGWGDGPRPSDCSDMSARQRTFFPSTQARVELTIDAAPAACRAAKARLAKLKRDYARYTRSLRNARRQGRPRTAIERLNVKRSDTNRRIVKARADVRRLC
jgi:hypothetical protein